MAKTKFDKDTEKGFYLSFRDLIEMGVQWDPVGAFFCTPGGYSIFNPQSGRGRVLDPDGEEIYLTQSHIDSLFKYARRIGQERKGSFANVRLKVCGSER